MTVNKRGHNLPPFLLLYLREAVNGLKYIVIKGFMDVDGFKKEGSIIEVDAIRAAKLRRYGLIAGSVIESASIRVHENAIAPGVDVKESLPALDAKTAEAVDTDVIRDTEPALEHVGGGFYLLPDGTRVKGKARAIQVLKESR